MHAAELLRELLPETPLSRANAPFALLEVKGPDAADFLQRLCSQDVAALRDGDVKPAAFLDAKGKLLATCLVARIGGAFVLETHTEQSERLFTLLERYHFTEKLAIARLPERRCHEVVTRAAPPQEHGVAANGDGVIVTYSRRGIAFVRAHGQPIVSAKAPGALSVEQAECVRMLAGLLRVGVETEPTTLALEADLDDHVSTTKGCYTGQEIVARIHTYGHVNRKACLLHLGPGAPITAAQPLHEPADDLAVGRVLHAVPIPGRDARLGVGYLPKDFQAIGTKLVLADKGVVEVIGYEPLPDLPA